MSGRELIFKNRFCNTLDGATDQDVVVFAEQLEELFPHRPEILDPMHMRVRLAEGVWLRNSQCNE